MHMPRSHSLRGDKLDAALPLAGTLAAFIILMGMLVL